MARKAVQALRMCGRHLRQLFISSLSNVAIMCECRERKYKRPREGGKWRYVRATARLSNNGGYYMIIIERPIFGRAFKYQYKWSSISQNAHSKICLIADILRVMWRNAAGLATTRLKRAGPRNCEKLVETKICSRRRHRPT